MRHFNRVLLLLTGLCLVLFQNCTDPQVVLSKMASELPVNRMSLKASICSDVSFLQNDNTNFLFVLDLSRSNIGAFREEMQDFGGGIEYPVYYWDPSEGTDVEGNRFEAIKTFINSCASSENNKFAIIGFGEKAGIVQQSLINRPYLICSEPPAFKTREQALADLEDFKQAEQSEAEYYSQWIDSYYDEAASRVSLALSYTSYSDASDCASKVINQDLVASYDQRVDRYQVIFLSDGRPEDSAESISQCNEKSGEEQDQCYTDFLLNPFNDSLREVSALRRSINFLTIGYGIEEQDNFRFLDSLASIQRPETAEKLDNFSDNSEVLCEMISTRIGVETQSDSLMSSVLSLGLRNGEYLADSDIDGVFDIDEQAMGYDPTHPRSQVAGVLDGVCELLGGIGACNRVKEQVDCEETLLHNSGFSDCDIKMIQHEKQALNLDDSADWDKDGVPNFIEIVKGTDPFIDDMGDDPDNDGLSTRYEIMRSKNPFEHEDLTNKDLRPVIVSNEALVATDYCPQRTRHLVVEEVPPVPSLKVGVGMSTEMLHGENEHVVAVFSSRKTQNFLLEDKGVVGRFVKLHYDDSLENNPFLAPALNEIFSEDMEVWQQ